QSGRMEVQLLRYSDEVIIQPNMEVLVPKDFDPIDFLNMGEIADVVRTDVVSIYRLTKRSVFRALREGWNAAEIENFLDRVSRHDVPDNVLKTIKGWSSSHAEAHIIKGTFLVFPDARNKVPQGLEEILPGIFRIPEKCDNDIAAFLDKRDVMVRGMDIEAESHGGISWGKLMPIKELSKYQWKSVRKEGIYPFGMVTPLPYGTRGEVVFEEALHEGRSLIIFYPKQGYGEIQVKKISPIYLYRKGGVPFVEAFCEDTGEGEVFDISKVRGLFKTIDAS
ncbi:MAG: helicase-associated domain-containing protein, partial [Deltaproteobacteria bacterium]|nr:helicase-associated domain-containing protein [Deltaproteobacteria bacterium]